MGKLITRVLRFILTLFEALFFVVVKAIIFIIIPLAIFVACLLGFLRLVQILHDA